MQYNTANGSFVNSESTLVEVVLLGNANGSVAVANSGGLSVNVIGQTVMVSNTPTINTSAYVANNLLGGLMVFTGATRSGGSANSGLIQSVSVSCMSNNAPTIDLLLFTSNPANTIWTDHTSVIVANTDLLSISSVVHISDWTFLGGPNFGQSQNLGIPFVIPNGSTLYGAMIIRSPVTFTTTTDLIVKIRILQD
jgi:hypothetical protein